MNDYIGVLAEPEELGKASNRYLQRASDTLHLLDKKCYLVDDKSTYLEGAFDLVNYDELPEYVGDDSAFITGTPESIAEAADALEGDVTVDSNVLERNALEVPSDGQVLREEALSFIPMYEPDRRHVEFLTAEDTMKELGIENADAKPLESLASREEIYRFVR